MKKRVIFVVAGVLATALHAAQTTVATRGDDRVLENDQLRVTIATSSGAMTVLDKTAGHEWKSPSVDKGGWTFRDIREVAGPPRGIALTADLGPGGKPGRLIATLSLPDGGRDLSVTVDLEPPALESWRTLFPGSLTLDSPASVLAVADYCNGHIYPLDAKPFPRRRMAVSRLDMPWVGVCDLKKGVGYAIIVETPDDAYVEMKPSAASGREIYAPQLGWTASHGKFAYPRKFFYHFSPQGGYVALAKRYRLHAQSQGLVVTLAEKLKKNPNLARLFGAPDVWGDASLAFARQARQAGVEKMLIQGRRPPEELKAVNDLGYLTSEYDNYTDVLPIPPGKQMDRSHDVIPDSVVLRADGERMKAWLTWDKKQFMKRCPALWVRTARATVPDILSAHPFLGRFIDVTTAEDLYECRDPSHPLTRQQKRQCGADLLGYVRSLNLVVGGEHGIWWAVPYLDYIEGMMSCNAYFSWPAGHLKHPRSKDDPFTSPWGNKMPNWQAYETYGIGHEHRVPLWELVFHDCIVSTWYWGDASDWLLEAAPEITPKKDAFNVLYGTIPLLWANKEGSWVRDRDVFLRTCRNTCRLHEVLAGTEMLTHEFLTPDRAVQRTTFSDGTEVVVNFGPEPRTVRAGGKERLLPQNGFAVKGPKIEQSLELIDGKAVTEIRTKTFQFRE